MLLRRSFEVTLAAAFALTLTGCTDGSSDFSEVRHDESEVAHDDHGHGHHGPNGGEIVELGNEEFHAEVVVDESTHRVDIFVLGSDAQTAKPIEATEISLSFKHGDEVEEFKLTAAPLDGEPEGQSSKFTLSSEELFEELHEHSEGATLSFTVGETTLKGTVTHSHDHDHGHGDEHAHDDKEHGHAKHDADDKDAPASQGDAATSSDDKDSDAAADEAADKE